MKYFSHKISLPNFQAAFYLKLINELAIKSLHLQLKENVLDQYLDQYLWVSKFNIEVWSKKI